MTHDDRVLGLFKNLVGELKVGRADEDVGDLIREAAQDPERRVGAYLLLDELGSGGAGRVYRAWHEQLKRLCAIKFLATDGEEQRARFEREAQIAARLSHPCIVAVHEVGVHRGAPYIVMEYVDGPALAEVRLTPRQALEIMRAVAAAVQFAHDRGVLHRDLKPSNILLGRDGRPRITDFGLARTLKAGMTVTAPGRLVGTPAYMTPECVAGALPTVRSDVYALGATLYALLCGAPPYTGTSLPEVLKKICASDPPPLRRLAPSINRDVETIVRKAMAREPHRRYPTAESMAEDIGRYLEGRAITARPPSLAYSLKGALGRNRVAAILAAILALLAGGGLLVLSGQRRRFEEAQGRRAAEERRIGTLLDAGAAALRRAEEIQFSEDATLQRVREEAQAACGPIEEALGIDPRHAAANSLMGRAMALMRRQEDALRHFSAAIEAEPELFSARYGRGCLYLRRSQERGRAETESDDLRRRALEDLQIAARAGGRGWEAVFAQASAAFAGGRYEEALRLCDGAPPDDPSAADMHLLAARALWELDRHAEAVQRCTLVLRLRPGHAAARIVRGGAWFDLAEYAKATEDYRCALKYDPDRPHVWHILGLSEFQAGHDPDLAIQAFDRAVALDPSLGQAYADRALVRIAKGDGRAAIQDLEVAIQRAPDDLDLRDRVCTWCMYLGDLTRALEFADETVRRFPSHARAYAVRARVRERSKEVAAAEEDCAIALRLDPDCAQALVVQGYLRISARRYREAFELADRAVALCPKGKEAYGVRGEARLFLGEREAAKQDLRKAAGHNRVLRKLYEKMLGEPLGEK